MARGISQPVSAILAAMLDFSKILFYAKLQQLLLNLIGESFMTSLFTFCFISIHFQVEKETR